MSSDDLIINAVDLGKRYEVYANPRDRLKQFIVPPLLDASRKVLNIFSDKREEAQKNYYRELWALKSLSFQLRRGETLGVIGRNGSGKSTLLQIVAGTLRPSEGHVTVKGRVAALLELGSGFNPEFSGHENVLLNAQILGLSRKEIEERYDQIVAFADIGAFLEQPVKTYSSGMFIRLAFAVQAHIDAAVVIIDEALAVGDVFFRQKCYARLEQLRNSGAAIILVSHGMGDIQQYCQRAILLQQGEVRFMGPAEQAVQRYYLLHQPSAALEKPRATEREIGTPADSPSDERPPASAFLDISGVPQLGSGKAHCTGFAICDAAGQPSRSFRQGDTAMFYYEFEIYEGFEVPICGLEFANDRNVIVHGKSAWQHSVELPLNLRPGSRIACRQKITLNIASGEYAVTIGLIEADPLVWANRKNVPFEFQGEAETRICSVPNIGSFSVRIGLRHGVSYLTHHGIADLQGSLDVSVHSKD